MERALALSWVGETTFIIMNGVEGDRRVMGEGPSTS